MTGARARAKSAARGEPAHSMMFSHERVNSQEIVLALFGTDCRVIAGRPPGLLIGRHRDA